MNILNYQSPKIVKNSYRNDLQFLRGISVFLVIFYHLQIPGFVNGYLGVDIFFVLSGFFMAKLLDKVSKLDFYKRRLQRLLPAYLVTVIFSTILVIIFTSPVDANQRLDRLWFDIFGLSNIAFWHENSYFDSTAFKPLLNLWSLGVEIQFYFIAPFLLPFLRRKPILLVALIMFSLLLSFMIITISPKTSFFMLPTRLWEFLIGAAVAWFPFTIKNYFTKNLTGTFMIIIFLIVIFFYPLKHDSLNILTGHPGICTFIIVFIVSVLLIVRVDELISLDNFFGKFFVKLGDLSYSIYLTHFPIIVLVNYIEFGGTILGYENLLELLLIFFLMILTSLLMFNYVEVMRYKNSLFFPMFFLFFLMFLLLFSGSSINKHWYTKEQNSIFSAWEDRASYRCGKIKRILSPFSTTCQYSKINSNNRVLLLGNSHADSIKFSFTEVMTEHDISTYFFVANAPLMSTSTNEMIIVNDIMDYKIGSIVIHYSPSFYREEKNIKRLDNFLNIMNKNDVVVFFIAPVPIYEKHIPKAMIQNTYNPDYLLPKQNLDEYFKNSSSFYEYVNKREINKKFIYLPHNILCNSSLCLYEKNNKPYYFDSEHLTLTGAYTLIPLFNDLADSLF